MYSQMLTERVLDNVDMVYYGGADGEFNGFIGAPHNISSVYTTYRLPGVSSAAKMAATAPGFSPWTLANVDAACDGGSGGDRNGKHPTLKAPNTAHNPSCRGGAKAFLATDCKDAAAVKAAAVGYDKSGARCVDGLSGLGVRNYYTVEAHRASDLQYMGTGKPGRFFRWYISIPAVDSSSHLCC